MAVGVVEMDLIVLRSVTGEIKYLKEHSSTFLAEDVSIGGGFSDMGLIFTNVDVNLKASMECLFSYSKYSILSEFHDFYVRLRCAQLWWRNNGRQVTPSFFGAHEQDELPSEAYILCDSALKDATNRQSTATSFPFPSCRCLTNCT